MIALWLSGCGAHVYHIVEPGETLYSIGWIYGYDHQQVAQWNDLSPPYRIKPGQRLRVAPYDDEARRPAPVPPAPPSAVRDTAPPAPAASVPRAPLPDAAQSAKRDAAHGATAATADRVVTWQWPAKGALIRTFADGSSRKKGIAIAGATGQPVYASSSGKVVYSGGGLVGYGRLIIITHDKHFLSAYGHNSELLVNEGDQVEKGQMIARMGNSGTDRTMLHFEIRYDGKPVDPLRYLPKVEH